MRIMNTGEDIPKYFYVFIGNGTNMACQINLNNYNLCHKMRSAGLNSILFQPQMLDNYIKGNIDYCPFLPAKTTLCLSSSHMLNVINGYNTEYALERYRKLNYPSYPSRFSCLYAFGDYESCEKASQKYHWDINMVKKFKLHDFSKDGKECAWLNNITKICKCNMEIVTSMWKMDLFCFPLEEGDKLCYQYWNAFGKIAWEKQNILTKQNEIRNSDILYEYLIEGMLEEVTD